MNLSLDSILNKTVLVGLSYFDRHGELLQQQLLSGVVVETDKEKGIAVQLHQDQQSDDRQEDKHFVLPASLSCWFTAPKGNYHTSNSSRKIENPDYLVTWDIFQQQEEVTDGDHQWWEWQPRTVPPQVGPQ